MSSRAHIDVLVALSATLIACSGETVYGDRCGPGTLVDAGVCNPEPVDASTVTCGAGTMFVDGVCVPAVGDAGDAALDVPTWFDAATACSQGGNVFQIAGSDLVYDGPPLVVQDGDAGIVTTAKAHGLASYAVISVGEWQVELSTRTLGLPLSAGSFSKVGRASTADPNQPGLYVHSALPCVVMDGSFTIVSLSFAPNGDLDAITANYEQHCVDATKLNYGCVHVKR